MSCCLEQGIFCEGLADLLERNELPTIQKSVVNFDIMRLDGCVNAS